MDDALRRRSPADLRELRDALFAGEIFLLAATDASRAFVDGVDARLRRELGRAPRQAHRRLSPRAVFEAIGRVRRAVYLEPAYHSLLRAVLGELGFALDRVAFDPARLRAVLPDGDLEPAARAAYFGHRDTWYANPQGIVTVWIPLADLAEEETFLFYRDAFARPLPNDSEAFDYQAWVDDDWSNKIGWQRYETGLEAHYPRADVVPDAGPPTGFSCRRGERLLFSGAHYHRTRPHRAPRIRFSLDFRAVHLDDAAAERGAPNVDNRSRGSCLDDYVHPDRPWPP